VSFPELYLYLHIVSASPFVGHAWIFSNMSASFVVTVTAGITAAFLLFYYVILGIGLRQLGIHLTRRTAANRDIIIEGLGFGDKGKIVGFFHPYCNAGGGGERVLWAAIRAIQSNYPHVMNVVYTGDQDTSKDAILLRVKERFSIDLDHERIVFIYLSTRHYVAASTWPHFTLLGQSLGSLVLAWDAFSLLAPDVFIDTMGYAFTLPFAKLLFGIPTAAYVHYPTISTDMLGALPSDSTAPMRTRIKRKYWLLFAGIYARCGQHIDRVMVNSSWTAGHIRALWNRPDIAVVFPPCPVTQLLEKFPAGNGAGNKREKLLLCIAQFRPEKNHKLCIDAFAEFYKSTSKHKDARLVLVGSVRHPEDATRVYDLRIQARELSVKDQVLFVTDAPWTEVQKWLGRASIGVNAMWNEHFGIGVVEYQAGGLISVVHDSGGPKEDIVVEIDGKRSGYLPQPFYR
jgi:alpha-1,2-mannosyltransferase